MPCRNKPGSHAGAGGGTHSFTGYYSALPNADQWRFAQFNNLVFAVQINVAPQKIDLTTLTAFSDVAGSPPQARYISVVGRFLVLWRLRNKYTVSHP